MTNREIAQEISNRIGTAPVPFDSVYSIALEIYHQLGGEESQFDSVYSILLEILPLVEGGGNGKAIEIVDALPEASENKDKFFRLSSDDNVYVSELKSRTSTTTNRLPDEQQIDKAYLYYSENDIYYYKGAYKIICADGELNWFLWEPQAEDLRVATSDNAVNITSGTPVIEIHTGSELWSNITKTSATTTMTMQEVENDDTVASYGSCVYATYNAPEANQIGNAYMYVEGRNYYYTGIQKTIVCSDGSLNLYQWGDNNDEYFYFTEKQASELYLISDADEGVIYTDFNVAYITLEDGWEVSGNTYANLNMSTEDIWDTVNSYGINPIYIPQLNAHDSEQVDNAYIYDIYGQHKYFYKGLESIVCTDGTINAPHWVMEGTDGTQENNSLFTTPTANSLYKTTYENAFGVLNYSPNYSGQDYTIFYDTTNNVWKSTINRESTEEMLTDDGSAESLFNDGVNISTVKYQRTEVTEEWDWQRVVTEDELEEKVYEGSATLLYSNQMELTGVTDVAFSNTTLDEIATLEYGKIKMTFTYVQGTLSTVGNISRLEMELDGQTVSYPMLTFNFMDMQSGKFKTLYLMYDSTMPTPSWTFQL